MANPLGDAVSTTTDSTLNLLLQGGKWDSTVLTYSFSSDDEPSSTWTPALKNAVRYAFTQWSAVSNLTFEEIAPNSDVDTSPADIAMLPTGTLLGRLGAVAIGVFPDPEYADQLLQDTGGNRLESPHPEGDIYLDNLRAELLSLNLGGSGIDIVLHEIGHALGLKHPEDPGGNGRPTGSINPNLTVMTAGSVAGPLSSGHAVTPLLYDIVAIQHIYGANFGFNMGDDTYNLRVDGTMRAIWDAGGNDTLNFSAVKTPFVLTLAGGHYVQLSSNTLVGIAFDVRDPNTDEVVNIIENAIGGAAGDGLTGNAADNRLEGRGGDDTLDGAGGAADTLAGGAGNDTYWLRHAGDVVLESANAGDDQILTFLSFNPMPENVERLFVQTAALDATVIGNAGNNLIVGTGWIDHLEGGAGNDTLDAGSLGQPDTLVGGPGDDVYRNGDPDLFVELPGEGIDTIESIFTVYLKPSFENVTLLGPAYVDAFGNAAANVLRGNDGDNFLDGKGGADTLIGGGGNDTYVLGVGDVLIDSGGSDSVLSTVSQFALSASLENLSLAMMAGAALVTGSASANHIVGNSYSNTLSGEGGNDTLEGGRGDDFLFGGSGADRLDGGFGADVMDGGAGNDVYVVSATRDEIVELAGGGVDRVEVQAVRYALDATVENAIITRASGSSVTGNALANTIEGGPGADRFIFASRGPVDRIVDFTPGTDKIVLDDAVFTGPLVFGTNIEYDAGAGALFYNDVQFATLGIGLEHPAFTDADLQLA